MLVSQYCLGQPKSVFSGSIGVVCITLGQVVVSRLQLRTGGSKNDANEATVQRLSLFAVALRS